MVIGSKEQLEESLSRTIRKKGYRKDLVREVMNQLGRVIKRYQRGKKTDVLPRTAIGSGIYTDNAQMLRRRGLLDIHYRGRHLFLEIWTVTPTEQCLEL